MASSVMLQYGCMIGIGCDLTSVPACVQSPVLHMLKVLPKV